MICVSISSLDQLSQVLKSGATLLELRVDLIGGNPERIYSKLPSRIQTIATCRPDGYNEAERTEILKICMDRGASFIDLELESSESYFAPLADFARHSKVKIIVSHHDIVRTPSHVELENLIKACYKRGGDIAKIATQVSSMQDVRNLLSLYNLPGKKVVLGMGKMGRITRLAGPYLGAEFTFASPVDGEETAPGQLSYHQLRDMYKVIDES